VKDNNGERGWMEMNVWLEKEEDGETGVRKKKI